MKTIMEFHSTVGEMDWPNKVNTQAIRVNILQMKLESKFYLGKLGQHKTVETKANKK